MTALRAILGISLLSVFAVTAVTADETDPVNPVQEEFLASEGNEQAESREEMDEVPVEDSPAPDPEPAEASNPPEPSDLITIAEGDFLDSPPPPAADVVHFEEGAFLDSPPPPGPELESFPTPDDSDEFLILGKTLGPGELRQFNWEVETAMAGLSVPVPVLVAHGTKPGPTLCLVAAIHGDELNGVEIVRRIMFDIDLQKLAGSVVGVPIANSFGFLRTSRYLPDRRDLNRHFPGDSSGSMASRFAHALFTQVISHCEVLVDIHTGSFYRTNLPQIRADLRIGRVLHLTKQFGDIAVLHSVGPSGSLRQAATAVGISAVTMETGGPSRFQEGAVEAGVTAIEALLNHLDMIKRFRLFGEPLPVIYESTWVRAETGGILLSNVKLGDIVERGQSLGTVTDPIQNEREVLKAPFRGRLLGMAVNQVVMPGFAAFHIGRAANEQAVIESTVESKVQADADDLEDRGPYDDEAEFLDPPSDRADDSPEGEQTPGGDAKSEPEYEATNSRPTLDALEVEPVEAEGDEEDG